MSQEDGWVEATVGWNQYRRLHTFIISYRVPVTLLVAIIIGGALRLLPLFLASPTVPLGGGGLYVEMAEAIRTGGFAYPDQIAGYTVGGVPFAYPPLVFYGLATLSAISGPELSTVSLLIWGPCILSILTTPALYWLATGLFDDQLTVMLATVGYAVLGAAFDGFIGGEGIIEVVATLGVLVGIGCLVRTSDLSAPAVETIRWRYVILTGTAFALTTLSSPGGALAFSLALVVFTVAVVGPTLPSPRKPPQLWCSVRVAVAVSVLVGVIGVVGSSPWWWTVTQTHGIGTLLNAAESRQLSLLRQILAAGQLIQFGALWGAFALIGAFYALLRKRLFTPLLFGVVMFATEVDYIRPALAAILGGVAIRRVILPALQSAITHDISLSGRTLPVSFIRSSVTGVFIVAVVIHGVGASSLVSSAESNAAASPAVLQALDSVERRTPVDSRFLVVDPEPEEEWWLGDWFPALTDRTAIDVRYGSEWTGAFYTRRDMDIAVNGATTLAELRSASNRYGSDAQFTHVFIRRQQSTEVLIINLRENPRSTLMYENSGGAVFSIASTTESA